LKKRRRFCILQARRPFTWTLSTAGASMGGQRKSRRRFSIISALSWSRRNFSAASAVRLLPFLPSNSPVAHADSPHARRLPSARDSFAVCCCLLCCLLSAACCLLPAVCYLLSAVCCLLSTAVCCCSRLNLVPARTLFILLSHAGRTGSIALWDNRCTQHLPLDDYAGRRREMIRVTIGAQVPA
jgi:hypothetical protein